MDYNKETIEETIRKIQDKINDIKKEEPTSKTQEDIDYLRKMRDSLDMVLNKIAANEDFKNAVDYLGVQTKNICDSVNKSIKENKWDEMLKNKVNQVISDEQLDNIKKGFDKNIAKADKTIKDFMADEKTKEFMNNAEKAVNKGIGKSIEFFDNLTKKKD